MGVDLGIIPRHRGIDSEGFYAPLQVSIPVATLKRQAFTQRRLINLDNTDTGRLQIRHFVTQRQRNLLSDGFTADIFTREGPAQNGHRAGEHTFHRFVGQRLSEFRPLNGDRLRTADVTDHHRRFHAAGAVALDPAVLREDEAIEVLAEVLHHVVTLGFAVNQNI